MSLINSNTNVVTQECNEQDKFLARALYISVVHLQAVLSKISYFSQLQFLGVIRKSKCGNRSPVQKVNQDRNDFFVVFI